MLRPPPSSTLTDSRLSYPSIFRSFRCRTSDCRWSDRRICRPAHSVQPYQGARLLNAAGHRKRFANHLKEGIPMATLLGADITPEEKQQLAPVGYSSEGEHRATCVLVDQDVRHIAFHSTAVEILPLNDPPNRYTR